MAKYSLSKTGFKSCQKAVMWKFSPSNGRQQTLPLWIRGAEFTAEPPSAPAHRGQIGRAHV